MTPFLQFRIWFRRASAAQKAATAIGVALLAALVVWSAVPSANPGSALLAIGGPAGASSAGGTSGGGRTGAGGGSSSGGSPGSASLGSATGSGGVVDTSAAGSQFSAGSGGGLGGAGTSPGPSIAGSGGSPPGTSAPTSGASGSTAAQTCSKMGRLRIGVVVPTAAGGAINAIIGSPPTAQEEADYAAVFDSVNKAGGVDCNDLVGDYATADLTNPSSAQAGCLQFQQDKVFAVLGGFEPLFTDDCLLQAHIPTFDQLPIPLDSVKRFYPYYYTDYPTYDVLYNNFVHAVNQMGYFSPSRHFAKLGIFYDDCTPAIHRALISDLASVGVSGSKVDSFDLGCNGAFASPTAIEQAVLQFKTDGVTTATLDDDIADGQNISNIANTQGWKPTWILPDYGEVAVQASANEHPNAGEFNGAVAITAGQYGGIEAHLPETPATQACDQVMTSHHLPTVFASGDQFAGSACGQVSMLVGAIEHGSLSAAGIAAGLRAVKSIPLSFPLGPNDFSAPGTTWGGQYWRVDTYHGGCGCWMVDNPTWNPSF